MIDFLGSLLVVLAITFAAGALIIVSGNALMRGGDDDV